MMLNIQEYRSLKWHFVTKCTNKAGLEYDCTNPLRRGSEALPGVLGNRGSRAFISGEKENKCQILRGSGEQRQYWGTGNTENNFSIFGEQGNKPIYFRGTREQVAPWEGLGSVGLILIAQAMSTFRLNMSNPFPSNTCK